MTRVEFHFYRNVVRYLFDRHVLGCAFGFGAGVQTSFHDEFIAGFVYSRLKESGIPEKDMNVASMHSKFLRLHF